MHSVVARDSGLSDRFEEALEAAITRYDGSAPITAQIRDHFGFGDQLAARRGSRLRAHLLMTVAAEEGADLEESLDAACAIEILHNYTLIHDDIKDEGRARHGRETVWSKWGTAHGINAGDSLCAISYLALLESENGRPAERMVTLTRALHEANLAMCDGQARDIAFESAAHVTMDDYMTMIDKKIASLFGAACEMGALVAGRDPVRARAYCRLGRTYGLGFAIDEDVRGVDRSRRTWTFPAVWAAEHGDAAGAREAAMASAQRHYDAGDAIAERHDIDRGGRVRAFLSGAARRP
jgi:geranylgeranyl diphosphate synthase type I